MSDFKDSHKGETRNVTQKRRMLLKASIPAVLTLASKPSFGAVCNISGFVSMSPGHVSGVARHETASCGNLPDGVWKNPDLALGSSGTKRSMWYAAGVAPDPRQPGGNTAYTPGTANPLYPNQDPPATLFVEIFTHMTGDTRSLHQVIEMDGTLDQAAAQTYLNSVYQNWASQSDKISPQDVVLLHEAAVNGWTSFTNSAGTVISLVGIDVREFFLNTVF